MSRKYSLEEIRALTGVELLVEEGANGDEVKASIKDAVLGAAKENNQDLVEFLVGEGIDVEGVRRRADIDIAVIGAARANNRDLVEFLVGEGVDVGGVRRRASINRAVYCINVGNQDLILQLYMSGIMVEGVRIYPTTSIGHHHGIGDVSLGLAHCYIGILQGEDRLGIFAGSAERQGRISWCIKNILGYMDPDRVIDIAESRRMWKETVGCRDIAMYGKLVNAIMGMPIAEFNKISDQEISKSGRMIFPASQRFRDRLVSRINDLRELTGDDVLCCMESSRSQARVGIAKSATGLTEGLRARSCGPGGAVSHAPPPLLRPERPLVRDASGMFGRLRKEGGATIVRKPKAMVVNFRDSSADEALKRERKERDDLPLGQRRRLEGSSEGGVVSDGADVGYKEGYVRSMIVLYEGGMGAGGGAGEALYVGTADGRAYKTTDHNLRLAYNSLEEGQEFADLDDLVGKLSSKLPELLFNVGAPAESWAGREDGDAAGRGRGR